MAKKMKMKMMKKKMGKMKMKAKMKRKMMMMMSKKSKKMSKKGGPGKQSMGGGPGGPSMGGPGPSGPGGPGPGKMSEQPSKGSKMSQSKKKSKPKSNKMGKMSSRASKKSKPSKAKFRIEVTKQGECACVEAKNGTFASQTLCEESIPRDGRCKSGAKIPTTTTVTSSVTTIRIGGNPDITFDIIVTSLGRNEPTGNVRLVDETSQAVLGTAVLQGGKASLNVTVTAQNFNIGLNNIVAVYSGDNLHQSSVSSVRGLLPINQNNIITDYNNVDWLVQENVVIDVLSSSPHSSSHSSTTPSSQASSNASQSSAASSAHSLRLDVKTKQEDAQGSLMSSLRLRNS